MEICSKKLVSLNNVDIKFKEFFEIIEVYFGCCERFCHGKNIKIGEKSSCYFRFCSNNVEKYFICNRAGAIQVTCTRLMDKIYKITIPIEDDDYLKTKIHFE